MVKVVLSLGSNIGNSKKILNNAINDLSKIIVDIIKSPIAITEPISDIKQKDFYNQIIVGYTKLKPNELLKKIQNIEKKYCRERVIKNGPRTLDIDIVDYNGIYLNEKNLILPHPRAHKRAFVIELWKKIDFEKNAKLNGVPINTLKTIGKINFIQ